MVEPLPQTPSLRLDGRRAIVAGAGRGIGRGAAAALAAAGAAVTLVSRTEADLLELKEAIEAAGGTAEVAVLDVADTAAVKAFFDAQPAFHVLVNNAGTNRPADVLDVTEADFDAVFDLNVRAAFFVAQAAARRMVENGVEGSIIMVSSQMGKIGGPRRAVYCGTKHAMEGITKSMALDLATRGVRINTVCPTFIETPLTAPFLAEPDFRAFVERSIPMGRVGRIEEVMGAIVFLASDASALMTGSALVVDGGWTAA